MKDKTFPNFLQALALTICLMIILVGSWWLGYFHLHLQTYLPDFYIPLVDLAASVLCIPIVIYALKKSKINLFENLRLPTFKFFIMLVLLAVSMQILVFPLKHPIRFFQSFSNGEIEYLNFRHLRFDMSYAIRILHICILGPVIEEVFFRNILLHQFLKKYNAKFAILLSALLFTIYHCTPTGLGIIFILGLIFGYVYYKTNSLLACILLHSFSNMIVWNTAKYTVQINDSSLIKLFFFILAGILVIYLFIKYINNFQNKVLPIDEIK